MPLAVRVLLPIYAAASLLHFAHNAEYLAEYPNLPASLTSARVYAAWLAVTMCGAIGWFSLKRHRRVGFGMLAAYALAGVSGLDHYLFAPPMAHTAMMNFTIWFETVTGLLLLAVVCTGWFKA